MSLTTGQRSPTSKPGRDYDPYAHADALGVDVIERPIRTANGMWIPDHNLIVLRSGMKRPWMRSTLAHELGHQNFGHRDDRPKHEVQADRYAAENLIAYDDVIDLMRWTQDLVRIANELDVSGKVLRVYLNVHRLVG